MIYVLDEQQGASAEHAANAKERALVLAVGMMGCVPPIWRRVLVRESMWLNQLHDTIQVLFDWFDYQTHEFVVGSTHYGNPFKREDLVIEDDRDVTLDDIDLATRGHIVYHYHFGGGWAVEIRVEQIVPFDKNNKAAYPACMAGERAGPPEDCGGLDAFHDMLACIKEPHTDIGQEWIKWLGPDYDSEKCDLAGINKTLRERTEGKEKAEG